jgi:hypothetical protein
MRYIIFIFCLAFLVLGCSNNPVNDPEGKEENPVVVNPDFGAAIAVNLYFPQENSLCNLGTNITPTESTVFFEWQDNDSDNYKIVVENLSTGNIIERESTEDIIPITIQRATVYKWYVISFKGSRSEESETWQFYNAGPGVQSYTPFPAAIVAPSMAQSIANTNSVTLKWTGSDVDDDIVGYDVYFGTQATPSVYASDITANEANVSVTTGTIYYWKVITKDELGNTSDSGLYQFKVL